MILPSPFYSTIYEADLVKHTTKRCPALKEREKQESSKFYRKDANIGSDDEEQEQEPNINNNNSSIVNEITPDPLEQQNSYQHDTNNNSTNNRNNGNNNDNNNNHPNNNSKEDKPFSISKPKKVQKPSLLSQLPDSKIAEMITRIEEAYSKHIIQGESNIPLRELIHEKCKELMEVKYVLSILMIIKRVFRTDNGDCILLCTSTRKEKHLVQEASLIGYLQQAELLSSQYVYAEFGKGIVIHQ